MAASVNGSKATLFRLDGDVARKITVQVQGEAGGNLFVESGLGPHVHVVTDD